MTSSSLAPSSLTAASKTWSAAVGWLARAGMPHSTDNKYPKQNKQNQRNLITYLHRLLLPRLGLAGQPVNLCRDECACFFQIADAVCCRLPPLLFPRPYAGRGPVIRAVVISGRSIGHSC